ncbi:MAG: hypothetical protein R2822_11335 [Spirosomataceae bacterium]
MIAGGSAAIVTGVVLVVVGVLLVPESGAVGVGIAVVGVAAIAGGAAADIYGIVDLVKKEDKIVAAKRRIQELDSDKAAMISIKDGSQGMVDHTASIYKALDQIVTNWQQMQNDVQNTMTAIRSIDDPTGLLQKWIVAAQGADAKMSPSAMYNILQAKLVAPGNSWADAAQKATALLNGLANSVEKTLPANTVITQDTINAAAVNRAA